ncbi:MAG: type II secretion system protein [Chloroflexi bacterium]|nr:type II secretion system protein [Chloroflexota bacterium]
MKKLMKGQKGFTLIELVVVIAILGVLAAVSVPLVVGYLSQAKERAYDNDVKQVQNAVDSYYSSPDNTKWLGKRQYPIKGMDKTSSTPSELFTDGTSTSAAVTSPKNPLGGSVGGNPVWLDDGDGIRNEENLNGPADPDDENGWHMATAIRETKTYYVDTRDYIIDMTKLTAAKLLDGIPASASTDNGGTGSYTYYVDVNGNVQTLLATFPKADTTGFKDVHP